ncbi:ABC transporter ATP-binding protein [Mangrovivirga sp. M17]|uniref:ABC transporter ATP-binding protein n=1 Tax=Mangrovivirga halotolerans TaxID=2993936 RepID=A0ABT3RRA4_9BACT|nr:ABC transporter ATP-binding protein [Mangrovivirga halotolerans]MCX2744135.1 ABC transporter ATP-binding protein [Mangrovivirga halotolerans]
MNTIEIQNLTKTYPNGVKALDNVSLSISNGMFGLLGANGAGKSTLMRTIATLQQPDSGTVTFNDIDTIKKPQLLRAQLGYLPQEFGVYPKVSALKLLDYVAILKGILNKKERRDQIEALLVKTNLYQHRKKSVYTFSGGMKQRFGIAQALLGNPKLIIVDEPTAGLDPEERNRFLNLLSEIGENVIVILSTHIVEDVHALCSRMAILANGTIIKEGKPTDLVNELNGHIWSKTLSKNRLDDILSLPVISTRIVSGNTQVRVKSGSIPGPEFEPVSPTLEDVYFTSSIN